MREVSPDIFMITEYGALGALMPPVNVYVLAGPDGLIFDAGYGRKKILAHLEKELQRIETVVSKRGQAFNVSRALPSHTHPDHFSGLKFLKERFGIRSLLTQDMAANMSTKKQYYRGAVKRQYSTGRIKELFARLIIRYYQPLLLGTTLEEKPDEIISDHETLSINGEPWQVLPAPGHCDDHISLYQEDRGILFSGDNIMRSVTTWLGPPRSDLDEYEETLKRILALPRLNLILSGHGSPVTEPAARIEELLVHRRQRTREVLDLVKNAGSRGISPREIINTLYTGQESRKRFFADGWVMLTLEKLEEEKKIRVIRNRVYPNCSA